MLPATSMRDIIMHNVMAPMMNLFRGRRTSKSTDRQHDENEPERNEVEDGGSSIWSAFKVPSQQLSNNQIRRNWWKSLGQLQKLKDDNQLNPKAYSIPVDPSHIAKSRKKRTIGLYSYAPWLTNDVIKEIPM